MLDISIFVFSLQNISPVIYHVVTVFEHFHLHVDEGISDRDSLQHVVQTARICSSNSSEQCSYFHFNMDKVKYLAGPLKG